MRATIVSAVIACFAALATPGAQQLQRPPDVQRTFSEPAAYIPDMRELVTATSELRDLVDRFGADRQAILRFYTIPGSKERRARLRAFYTGWLDGLQRIDFTKLSRDGQVDYVLLRNHVEYLQNLLGREERSERQTAPLLPFADAIVTLQEDRQKLRFITTDAAAAAVGQIDGQVRASRAAVEAGLGGGAPARVAPLKPSPLAAVRAAERIDILRGALDQWFGFYNGYDPAFTARVPEPYKGLSQALNEYARVLREKVAGLPPRPAGGRGGRGAPPPSAAGSDDIVGDPIGREGLLEDLAGEMIVYTPEELIEIGNREYAWCEEEMKKAAREMGFGDDWMAALDKVKNAYVPMGEQPELIRDLALEAEAFLKKHDMVTVPPLASDVWRMGMMSPERQRVNPFFTGGETISVSYPTDTMSPEDSMMSMRGNGIHVSRATVQHELIPGHHLMGFMSDRYNSHRNLFGTPFMREGWALYWELLLWDHGFPRSPEDRIGMLWWRMHRAARIIFSLNFHLGRWTPEQCIDFLVERVRHERFTATGEVRRSFAGNYSPLYQVAYMMGGLQIRSLHDDLVGSKKTTMKKFHDTILKSGSMPIEMLRALMTGEPLTRDYRAQWRYYGEVQAARD
ncbi:MAG TPA: DUF885 family protein [Vicinamibacterales bacterium]|nr:DUF885 family protein [Vicinamibacterales bacterium]